MTALDATTRGMLAGLTPAVRAATLSALGEGGLAEAGAAPLTLGVPDGAKAAVIAALAAMTAAPLLVVTARPHQALALAEDVRAWLPADDPRDVLLFPPRDTLPYERLAVVRDAVQQRLRGLAALARGDAPLIIADGTALAQRTAAPEAILPRLAPGLLLPPEALALALTRTGFRAEAVCDEPGTFARRGGLLDVFPATADVPVRIEWFGDVIDSLRQYDAATQRSIAPLDALRLDGATEAVAGDAARTLAARLDVSRLRPGPDTAVGMDLARMAEGSLPAHLGFWSAFLAPSALWAQLPPETVVIIDEPSDLRDHLEESDAQADATRAERETRGEIPAGLPLPHLPASEVMAGLEATARRLLLRRFGAEEQDAATRRVGFTTAPVYGGRLKTLLLDLRRALDAGDAPVLVTLQAPRLLELCQEAGLPVRQSASGGPPASQPAGPPAVTLVHGAAPEGWRLPGAPSPEATRAPSPEATRAPSPKATMTPPPLLLLTDREIFGFAKERRAPARPRRKHHGGFENLQPGDYLVHIEHGIGQYEGVTRQRIGEREREYLTLRYADNDRLLVPTDQLHRVQRYLGGGDGGPTLTRLGTQQWQRTKSRVRAAVRDLAQDLVALYAARQVLPGLAAEPDSPWMMELEASFPYVETPDQAEAVREVKRDMERPRPMDRLLVGDVGYGKTEVAVRAAFKAVLSGRQVAILVPTTVLAMQHLETFRRRLAPFPCRVEMLSRLRTEEEQRAVLRNLAAGKVDIVIGTHRLLQKDVAFASLGLVIIDEEQRFGVGHKERLKQMRREVDVLTLSATPIPRTLHMALAGIRDMSTIETPPEDRLPIVTYVMETDDTVIREAILREIERGGQVYFVHNRVQSIDLTARWLEALAPEARMLVAHGQMPDEHLAEVMAAFIAGQADVLICTTIIESGLDIPRVNTILIHQAQRLGLAQLYQLRGRVGRSATRAYAYLFYDRNQALSETAQKRLQAVFEATELGAGFQIAMRDLEIRGAGSLLGAEQSGHIGAVGFDLYTQMLAEAVEQWRAEAEGRPPVPQRRGPAVSLDLPLAMHLPAPYIDDIALRLSTYQRLAAVETPEEVDRLAEDLNDRFGPPPPPAVNLLEAVRLRALAARLGAESVAQEEAQIVVRLHEGRRFDIGRWQRRLPDGVRMGPTTLRFDLPRLGEGWLPIMQQVLRQLAEADAAIPVAPPGVSHPARAPERA